MSQAAALACPRVHRAARSFEAARMAMVLASALALILAGEVLPL